MRAIKGAEGSWYVENDDGQSHEVPIEEYRVVTCTDSQHLGAEIYRVGGAFRFVCLTNRTVEEAERCVLVALPEPAEDDYGPALGCLPCGVDLEAGLALVGLTQGCDATKLGAVLWDSDECDVVWGRAS